ncbi:MAG: DUF1559 domain-containing protein, partial [Planctomycetota bacterium]|nr:DUF1559 domain-containing protein [Planctomycetota bacterium]
KPTGGFKWNDNSSEKGVCFQRSMVRFKQIKDGLTKQYFIGEKFLQPQAYDGDASNVDYGDNETIYTGHNHDQYRTTSGPPSQDLDGIHQPDAFGSTHPGVWFAVMGDASVRGIAYEINADTHRRLGNRGDGGMLTEF